MYPGAARGVYAPLPSDNPSDFGPDVAAINGPSGVGNGGIGGI